MLTIGLGHAGKTGQAIGPHDTAGAEIILCPIGNGFAGKAGNRRHFDEPRSSLRAERERRDKWHLILRTAPGLAASQFATEIGIVHLDVAVQGLPGIPFDHGLHQFLLDQPSGRVTDAQLPFQSQGGQAGLSLADQVDRQKPDCQFQVGALE